MFKDFLIGFLGGGLFLVFIYILMELVLWGIK